MKLAVANKKGGVGKTTTAFNLAQYFQQFGPTLLIDGDPNKSAMLWGRNGNLPFRIVSYLQAPFYAKDYTHLIFDTQAGENSSDVKELAQDCDLMILTTTPASLDVNATISTYKEINGLPAAVRVLITKVPPRSAKSPALRADLEHANIPVFATEIPLLNVFDEAVRVGLPVRDVKNDYAESAWQAYEALGKEIFNGKAAKARRW